MKKLLSLVLVLVMVLGLSVPAFAAENDTSGSTTITATKAEPELAYTIVIPTATTLDNENHTDVQLGGDDGVAGIEVITHNSKTNVYYTVDLTNGTLKNGTNTITTSYAYAQGGDYSALTEDTEVTVYEDGTVNNSTIQVTADETSWAAAPAGTYTASVVFNFTAVSEEIPTGPVVTYMDWDSVNKELVEKPVPDDAIEVTNTTTALEAGKFYVVKGEDVKINSTLTVSGTTAQPTTLILMDGAKLTVTGTAGNAGINVASDKALVITGQSGGTGNLTATGGNYGAGIGGGMMGAGGTVTINGGTVTATGGSVFGAGIGGGKSGAGGTVTINGGTVTAKGGDHGAGIGGGFSGDSGTVNINGGTVTANGGIYAAGIGGGYFYESGGYGGTVNINGGTVTANGGIHAAGIGAGAYAAGGDVNINGGTVTATGGGGGAGIGGGDEGSGGTVNINGGTVTATGGEGGAGIGGGEYCESHGTVTFGEGVNFTVKAGDTAPGSETTTDNYKSNHSAAYVKIEKAPVPA